MALIYDPAARAELLEAGDDDRADDPENDSPEKSSCARASGCNAGRVALRYYGSRCFPSFALMPNNFRPRGTDGIPV
jgi:hypothetical protein